jgi:hypothetical protein
MPGSQTPRGSLPTRENAANDVAFHVYNRVGTPDDAISGLNSPPACTPVQRFAAPSRVANAWLGATVCR